MGCGASSNKIHVVAPADADNTQTKESKTIRVKSSGKESRSKSGKSRRSKDAWGSQDSLGNCSIKSGSDRGGSATSKASKHSGDSGFDDERYAKVVTESSDPHVVRQMVDEFHTPRNLDFGVVGQQCPQRRSAKERRAENDVMAALREEGLIQKPLAKTTCGMSYDIVIDDLPMLGSHARPPPRLAKLETIRKKKKKVLTADQLAAKMARTEARRKEREAKRLAKIQAVANHSKPKVEDTLDAFAERQMELEEKGETKQDMAAENREKKMLELKEKLRLKEERAAAVRERRKLMKTEDGDGDNEHQTMRRFSEDTPVGVSVEC